MVCPCTERILNKERENFAIENINAPGNVRDITAYEVRALDELSKNESMAPN
jgi:hypothetical protein